MYILIKAFDQIFIINELISVLRYLDLSLNEISMCDKGIL